MAQIAHEAKHMVNIDALARFKADAAALPHDIMNTVEEVQAKVQAEQEQMAQMQKMQAMEMMAGAAEKGASAMNKAGMIEDPGGKQPAEVPA